MNKVDFKRVVGCNFYSCHFFLQDINSDGFILCARRFTMRLFSVTNRTLIDGGGLTPLQRCSQCILQPQSIGELLKKVILSTE